jgi:hypothetical protein
MTEEQQPKIKIVIPPQVLEQMQQEMSEEDLKELLATIEAAVENGSIFEDSEPINLAEMERDDPEAFAKLKTTMGDDGFDVNDFDDWVEYVTNQRPTLN